MVKTREILPTPESILNLLSPEQFKQLLAKTILCRHGKTQANIDRVLQGSVDNPLSEIGKTEIEEQSQTLGDSAQNISIVASSGMKRAVETADIFASRIPNVKRIKFPTLHEFDYGSWEGKSVEDILASPENDHWISNRHSHEKSSGSPHGGESFTSFLKRVNDALKSLFENTQELADDQKILIVLHAEVIRAIRLLFIMSQETNGQIDDDLLIKYEKSFSFFSDDKFLKVPHGMLSINPDIFSLEEVKV